MMGPEELDDGGGPCKQLKSPILLANVFKEQVHHISCTWQNPCQLWESALLTRISGSTQAQANLMILDLAVCCLAGTYLSIKMAPADLLPPPRSVTTKSTLCSPAASTAAPICFAM